MIYLDNAATSFPKPECVAEAVSDCIKNWCANPGRAGHQNAMLSSRAVYDARKTAAEFVGGKADAEDIVFTCNCTHALNMAFRGILKKGDHVITTMMEHNSVLRPLHAMQPYGIEVSVIRCDSTGYPNMNMLEKALKKNTRMLVFTMSSNVTGTIMPIEEAGTFAAKHGIIFAVDGAQGMGSIPFDAGECGVQVLAASGHKGLMGPQGTGFLYVDRDVEIYPSVWGGTGTFSSEVRQPDERPEGFESGTLNVPGIAGLAAGMDFVRRTGIEEIRNREVELAGCLYEELKHEDNLVFYGPAEPEKKTGIVAFNVKNMECEAAAAIMDREAGIAVRAGFHCAPYAHEAIGTGKTGCIRVSVGPFNTYEDIISAGNIIRKICRGTV